jgi:hypothetical protein
MVQGNRGDVTIRRAVSCEHGEPISATLRLIQSFGGGTSAYPMTLDSVSNTYAATIMASAVEVGRLSVQATCPNENAGDPPITTDEEIGRIVLYDPSGIVSDAVTEEPITNAQVDLFRVPDWEPKTDAADERENTCHTPATRPGSWESLPPARALDETFGVHADPEAGRIDPTLNPQRTNQEGRYGWDVAKGCWYVVVRAEGYESRVSPVVGVPPEVTDLDLALTPDEVPAVPVVPAVQFSAATYQVAESATQATITVELTQTTSVTVTVAYATSDGTAEAGSDYTAASGTLTIAPGETGTTFDVVINNDTQNEPDETLTLTLSNAEQAVLGTPETATLTITDDDEAVVEAPDVQFSAAAYRVGEGEPAATITVTLSAAAEQVVTVAYATSDGTAEAGSDYTAITETLTFDPGVITQTFTISVTHDTRHEEDETLTLALREPVNANLGEPVSATLTIVDNDPPVSPEGDTRLYLPLVRR